MKKIKSHFEKIHLTKIKPYWRNVMKSTNVEEVKQSILQNGYITNIIVDPTYTIISGHSRYKALLELSKETDEYNEIEVKVLDDISPQDANLFRIIDNKIASKNQWDESALELELKALSVQDLSLVKSLFDFDIKPINVSDIDSLQKEVARAFENQGDFANPTDFNKKEVICPHCLNNFYI